MDKLFTRIAKKFHYGEKGFTLIELLIVIAVLGILAAVAIPNVASFLHSGTIAAGNSEVATLKTANQGYAADNGGSFAVLTQAGVSTNGPLASYLAGAGTNIKGTYTFDANGNITGAGYAGLSDFDTVNQKWVK